MYTALVLIRTFALLMVIMLIATCVSQQVNRDYVTKFEMQRL